MHLHLQRIKFRLLLAAAAVFTAPQPTGVGAFSPEIFNQVLAQLGSVTEYYAQVCPDELAFAAAQLSPLLDANQNRRVIPPLLPPAKFDGEGGADSSSAQLAKRPTPGKRVYNYEDLPSSQSVPGILDESMVRLTKRLTPGKGVYNYEEPSSLSVPGILDLTPQEEELIQLLRNVRNKFSPRTTIRIAGGWVRDKLIYGKDTPSRDVDLVLSDISGIEFAEFVCKYARGEDDKQGSDLMKAIDVRRLSSSGKGGKADQLQTASLSIMGFEVDFCRLRYEKYDKGSRIPVSTRVASVVEDAWRRDLTINCLYYNIGTNQVEDFTEVGIRDLILQQINTPKQPLRTLREDPTRILRAIRFAAQLSFDVSPELLEAARNNQVRSALQSKVSRDVIGKSVDEMFGTRVRDPSRGIQLLIATNLIDVIFPLGKEYDPTIYKVGLEFLSRTQSLVTRLFLLSPESMRDWDIEKRRFLWYAAFLKPVYDSCWQCSGKSKSERRQQCSLFQLLGDSLKRPMNDVDSVEAIIKGVKPIQRMMESNDIDALLATKSGVRLKDLSPQSSDWKDLSEFRWEIYSTLKPCSSLWKEAAVLAFALSQRDINACVNQYMDLVIFIEDQLHLRDTLIDKIKPIPLLNGSQIQRVLYGKIDGRDFRQIVQAMEEWQIRHLYDLEGAEAEERVEAEEQLIEYLVAEFPKYASATSRSV